MPTRDSLSVRKATNADIPAVVAACGEALQWSGGGTDEAFFRWKHLDNPFGSSPIWVAEDRLAGASADPVLVGVRAMMRWELLNRDGKVLPTVRAVDTATLPSHQGRGVFSRLTSEAIESLTAEGAAAVFNTPNDKSRGGYLKLGWHEVGRLPVTARPRTIRTAAQMLRSRVAADKWGLETDVGLDPEIALAEPDIVQVAIDATPRPAGLTTPLTVEYLRWRTAFEPLRVRIAPLHGSIDRGFVLFRLRHRSRLRQLSVLHVVGINDHPSLRRMIRRLLSETEADLVMASGSFLGLADGLLRLPFAGPILTWRPLASSLLPLSGSLDLELGALELF